MFKKFAAMFTYMVAFLGVSGNEQALINDGKLHLTDKQKEDLQKALGPKVKLEEVVTAMNAELADINKVDTDANDQQLIDLRKKAFDMLKEHEFTDAEAQKLIDNPGDASGKTEKQLLSSLVTAMEEQKVLAKEQDAKIAKLLSSAEDDSPLQIIRNTAEKAMQHSKTHLFGDNNPVNAFADRPWNQMAAGLNTQMPTFAYDSPEVKTLKGDMELFNRNVDSNLKSLFRDKLGLPSFWNIRTNVDDRVADGNIVTAEITQARKKGWLPKNRQLIQPEEDRIYPAQVDIEYAGYYLQTVLTSWIANYNKEGSQAYKWTFVRFLNQMLDERRAQEDRIVALKGVHVPTPDDATIPGLAINRGDGILIKLWRAMFVDSKIQMAQIGAPTDQNIVDYVKAMIEKNIPKEEINNSLVYYLSPTWLRRYKERKRMLFGHDSNYTGKELEQIENFPSISFCTLQDLEGSDFMFITYPDNIELLENVPGERGMYHMESLKRNIYIFGDYKWGARIKHIGTTVEATDPAAFKVQTVWANGNNPFPADFFVRLYDAGVGKIALPYGNITVTDDWATEINELTGAYEGQVVRIQGNTALSGAVNVKHNATKIALAGNADFNLKSGGVLTLRYDGTKFVELKRTTTPPTAPTTDADFTGTVVDANSANVYTYKGTSAKTLTEITGGVEGQTLKIVGNSDTNTITVPAIAGHISLASSTVALQSGKSMTFLKVDDVWTEISRDV